MQWGKEGPGATTSPDMFAIPLLLLAFASTHDVLHPLCRVLFILVVCNLILVGHNGSVLIKAIRWLRCDDSRPETPAETLLDM